MVVISDTSPLINLARIGQLDLIPRLFGQVLIPQAVYHEIVEQGAGQPGAEVIQHATWVEVRSVRNQRLVQNLQNELDPGESEAIALALESSTRVILMDEDLGRRTALRYQLQPLGILGILLKAKQVGLIKKVAPLLDALINTAGFYVHRNLYAQIIQAAGE